MDADRTEVEGKLEAPLETLMLPARLQNWADRKGLTSVRELVLLDPAALIKEKNLGRKSIADAREALARWLGMTWEQAAWVLLGREDSPDEEACEVPAGVLLQKLGPQPPELLQKLRAILLEDLELPTRIVSFVQGQALHTVGELLDLPAESWNSWNNLAHRSRNIVLESLQRELVRLGEGRLTPSEELLGKPTILDAWEFFLCSLPASDRMVLSRRSGAYEAPVTLQEIAEVMGVTRERVRQLEARGLREGPLSKALAAKLRGILESALQGTSFWWDTQASLPALQPFGATSTLVSFALDHGLVSPWQMTELEGRRLVLCASAEGFEEAWRALDNQLQEKPYPVSWRSLREEIWAAGETQAPGVGRCWVDQLSQAMHIDVLEGATEPVVLSFGEDRRAEVLALLRASPTPIRIESLREKLGRTRLPGEVIYLARGLVGLDQHFPEMARWQDLLVSPCVAWMAGSADRQWSAFELLDNLREIESLPSWMNSWHLVALLRRTPGVAYLGRQRFKLDDGEPVERLYFRDVLEGILREVGEPLKHDDLLARLSQQTSQTSSVLLILTRSPFVHCDAERWGLRERDVPGGEGAIQAACHRLLGELEVRGEGLTTWEALQVISVDSPAHASWTPELLLSVLRADERFHLARGSNGVGLSCWPDGPRVRTRPQFLEQLVREHGGRLAVTAAAQALQEKYGVALVRARMHSQIGRNLRIENDALVPSESSSDEDGEEEQGPDEAER